MMKDEVMYLRSAGDSNSLLFTVEIEKCYKRKRKWKENRPCELSNGVKLL